MIALHYHVHQPDGDELTTVDIDWGDGTPVESMTLTGGWLGAGSHIYVDDNPTGTPQDNYTITLTASDADGSVAKTLIASVKNADPVVKIDSLTAIDSVSTDDGGTNNQIDETEGFVVKGTVTDAGIKDTFPIAELKTDINFDGTVDVNETFSLNLIKESDGVWKFEHTIEEVLDDGAKYSSSSRVWGNETSLDALPITVDIEDDDTGTGQTNYNAEIHNVSPTILTAEDSQPTLEVELDSADNVIVTVSGAFNDVGINDFHRVSIIWGDGIGGNGATNPIDLLPTNRSFSVTRTFTRDLAYRWTTKGSLGCCKAEAGGDPKVPPGFNAVATLVWKDLVPKQLVKRLKVYRLRIAQDGADKVCETTLKKLAEYWFSQRDEIARGGRWHTKSTFGAANYDLKTDWTPAI